MGKAKKANLRDPEQPEEETTRTCLYEILGVGKKCSDEQIKKAYRVRALQCHPDKDPSADAKLNFQKLVCAYNILKDPESRKLYDETGFIEGEGFDKAADFFRTKFGRISEDDIVEFSSRYIGSAEEVDDVVKYYQAHAGNVADLLEWVPLSEPSEVDRFLEIIASCIKSGRIEELPKLQSSIPKLRKNAEKMAKEQARFSKENEDSDINKLVLAIQEKRRQVNESFLDGLIDKYAKPSKKSRK
jgi:DnaJ family protein C protein 9